MKKKELTIDKDGALAYDSSRFSYKPVEFGQAVYLQRKCEEVGIRTEYCFGRIRIYSFKKLELFESIIEESLRYRDIPAPDPGNNTWSYYKNRTLLCVALNKGEVVYVTESHMEELVEYIFTKRIPHPKRFFIYSKQYEMKAALEKARKIIV